MSIFTTLALLCAPSQAEQAVPVLLSAFSPEQVEATALALRMPDILKAELGVDERFALIGLEQVRNVGELSATMYMDSCPPGQLVGCSYVVGEAAQAAYAITGTVSVADEVEAAEEGEEEPETELHVKLIFLNIEEYREVLEVPLVHSADTEDSFADSVAMMLGDLTEGYVGRAVDIREAEPADPNGAVDKEAAARDLEALYDELGEVETDTGQDEDAGPSRVQRVHYTLDEMVEKEAGNEPWAELGMSPKEYVRWWNSGWDVGSWRQMQLGRKGQVLLRAFGGWGYGPTHAFYRGRWAQDNLLNLVEVYGSHEVLYGGGSSLGLAVGYGITPALEVEAGLSREGGVFWTGVFQEIDRSDPYRRVEEQFVNSVLQVALGARYVPLPTLPVRPLAGLGLVYWRGTVLEDHTEKPRQELPSFSRPHMVGARALLGFEAKVWRKLGLFVQAPLTLRLAGGASEVYDEDGYALENKTYPGEPGRFGAGVQAGVQLGFGGARVEQRD